MLHFNHFSHLCNLPGIFVPDFSTNPQVNQFLGPKSSSVPGQLHMAMPHNPQQQNPPQGNIPHQTQVPIAHSPHNVPPPLIALVNPPSVIPPQQLINPQPPVIPSPIPASTATYLPVPNIPQQKLSIHLKPAWYRVLPIPEPVSRSQTPLNCNPDLNLWRFPHDNPPNIIDVKSMQETYPRLAVLDPVKYSYGKVEMILGQDVYHAIRPLEYFAANEKCSPFAVRLPIGWVLSGPLPSSSCLVSTFLKAKVEQDYEIVCPVKSCYEMDSYGAYKRVDPRSATNDRAQEILETTTFHNGQRCDVGILWADDNIQLTNNSFPSLVQLKSRKAAFKRHNIEGKLC